METCEMVNEAMAKHLLIAGEKVTVGLRTIRLDGNVIWGLDENSADIPLVRFGERKWFKSSWGWVNQPPECFELPLQFCSVHSEGVIGSL